MFLVGIQYAFNWLIRGVGMAAIWLLSLGRIRHGERRDLRKPPPRSGSGNVFYSEGGQWYIYENFCDMVGLGLFLGLLVVGLACGFVRYEG